MNMYPWETFLRKFKLNIIFLIKETGRNSITKKNGNCGLTNARKSSMTNISTVRMHRIKGKYMKMGWLFYVKYSS